jgi:ATP-binding cassette subfamily B protein
LGRFFCRKREEESFVEETRRGKAALIWHFLRGVLGLFLAALVFSMLNTECNAVTPQIIRTTVDSIIGDKPFALPNTLPSGWAAWS